MVVVVHKTTQLGFNVALHVKFWKLKTSPGCETYQSDRSKPHVCLLEDFKRITNGFGSPIEFIYLASVPTTHQYSSVGVVVVFGGCCCRLVHGIRILAYCVRPTVSLTASSVGLLTFTLLTQLISLVLYAVC